MPAKLESRAQGVAAVSELLEELQPFREEFEQLVGERVSDTDWRRLVADYGSAADVELFAEDAAAAYRKWQAADEAGAVTRQESKVQPPPEGVQNDPRWPALAKIFALEAAERPDVRAWRDAHLPDGRPVPLQEGPGFLRELAQAEARASGAQIDTDPPETLALVWYPRAAHHVVRVYGPREGAIGELAKLARALGGPGTYPWTEPDAVAFVVAGVAPPVEPIVATVFASDGRAATTRISVEFDPRVPRNKILEAFELARQHPWVSDFDVSARPLRPETAELALVLARRRDETWRELREAWNREQPKRHYGSEREFARDVKRAWERVVGAKYGEWLRAWERVTGEKRKESER
jgi:hypothetical protein